MNELVDVLTDALSVAKKTGSDYTAKVTRVDGQTAYVQISGSDIADTPVAMSIGCKKGDMVRVRIADGRAWITGNDTAPPTDNSELTKTVEETTQSLSRRIKDNAGNYSLIKQSVDEIVIEVGDAQSAADAAQTSANAAQTSADAAQTTANGRMTTNMSNRASSITIGSGTMTFNSNSLVINSSQFTLASNGNATFKGALSAATGSFAGSLSAATGSFKGSLSAATGTFAGSLSAATGSFKGSLSAATGTFKGTVTVDWSSSARVYLGSGSNSPLAISSIVSGYDGSCQIGTDIISVAKDGGRTFAQMDFYSGFQWSSDRRIKKDIEDLDPDLAMELRPVSFKFTNDEDNKQRYGFIAQEVLEVMPDSVTQNKESGYYGLSYMDFIAPILALAQKNAARADTLEQRVTALEAELKELKERLNG